jgi:hypothetical protein
MRIALLASTMAALTLASPAAAQNDRSGRSSPRTYVGGGLLVAQRDGEFKNYVSAAFGASGHLVQNLDDRGIFSIRAEVGLLVYGSRTARQSLGGGAHASLSRRLILAALPALTLLAGMFLFLGEATLDRTAGRFRLFPFLRNHERAANRRAEPLLGDLAVLTLAPRLARDDANIAGRIES